MDKQLIYAAFGLLVLSIFGDLASSQQAMTVERAMPAPAFDTQNGAAIALAMQDKDFRTASAAGVPTVRHILPDTSKKYYAPKTLLSVTWQVYRC